MRGGMGLGFGSGPGADTHEAVIYVRGAFLMSGAQKELLACTRYQVQRQQASKQTTEVFNIDAYVTRLRAII